MQLAQTQQTSLAMSTQTIQSIEILQYSQQELHDFLTAHAEKNPLIDLNQPSPRSPRVSAALGGGTRGGGSRRTAGGDFLDISETHPSLISLHDHLRAQVGVTFRCQIERAIALSLTESIDPDGYMRRPLWEVADLMGISEEQVERVLMQIQSFEPVGVGTRHLGECLKLQLADRGELTPAMEILLANLKLLANHEIEKLSKLCALPREAILAMAKSLRRLNPAPGLQYDHTPPQPALPDVLVDEIGPQLYSVQLNPELLPRVLIDQDYYAQVSAVARGAEAKRYLRSCLTTANWLARQLDQRAQTVLKVASEVIKKQQGFLEHGIEHLKPLDQKDVAQAIGVHESTVSRAISNKYVMTPRGMFELKFFFPEGLANESEDGVATDTIRHWIRKLVDDETERSVLSDEQIVTYFRGEGIDIARRTVTKYRGILKIPSSAVRRRQKKLN